MIALSFALLWIMSLLQRTHPPYLQWYFFTLAPTLLPQQDCVSIVNIYCGDRQTSWDKGRLTINIKAYWSQGWASVTMMSFILIKSDFWCCFPCSSWSTNNHQMVVVKSTFSFTGRVCFMKFLCTVEQWWFCLCKSVWQLTEIFHSLFYLFESQSWKTVQTFFSAEVALFWFCWWSEWRMPLEKLFSTFLLQK